MFSITATVDAQAIPIPGLLLYMASGGEKSVSGPSRAHTPTTRPPVERGSSGTTPDGASSGTIDAPVRMLLTSLGQVSCGVACSRQRATAANHGLKTA